MMPQSSRGSCLAYATATAPLAGVPGPVSYTHLDVYKRQLYKGKHLLSFVDNHDVTRVASILSNEAHLPLIYAMQFGMPGIPCVYYGSEWGAKARKEDGDPALRACFDAPEWTTLTDFISRLAAAKKSSEALNYGDFRSVLLTNKQSIFERKSANERVLVAINAEDVYKRQPQRRSFFRLFPADSSYCRGFQHADGGTGEYPFP